VKLLKDIGLFGYRWMVETAYSVIKRKFTSYIREKRLDTQNSTLALLTLAYNLHVV
jgi:transposase